MIQTHTLSNGLRLVTEQIPHVRSVSIGIWVKVGSRHESEQNNGISHFIEHMLFKGTEKRSAREIAEAFDRIGGDINAFTTKEHTCYYAQVTDEHLDLAMDILADMYFHSQFDPHEMDKEKNVIIEELHMYDDLPDEYVHDLIEEVSYQEHPLGYHILGRENVLQELRSIDLHEYMTKHYTPHNTVIAIAGQVNHDKAIDLISEYFDTYSRISPIEEVSAPQFKSAHALKVKEIEQAHFCIGLQALSLKDDLVCALVLLNNILGGSMSSRLFQEIREEQGLAYSIFSYHTCFQDSGSINIYAGTSVANVSKVYDLCIQMLQKLATDSITMKELQNTKQQLVGNFMLSLESTNSRMTRLGRNELMLNRHFSVDEVMARIESITLENVNSLTEEIFNREHSFALISPLRAIPSFIRSDAIIRPA